MATRTKASAKGKQAREQRIAEGIVAGRTVSDLARQEGLTRTRASQIANSPAVLQRIAQLVDQRADRIESLFDRTLTVIEDGLEALDHKVTFAAVRKSAGKDAVPTEEEMLLSPPDHYARLAAAKRFIELVTAGRPPARHVEDKDKALPTLDQIDELLKSAA